jgi:hypothetical protein
MPKLTRRQADERAGKAAKAVQRAIRKGDPSKEPPIVGKPVIIDPPDVKKPSRKDPGRRKKTEARDGGL